MELDDGGAAFIGELRGDVSTIETMTMASAKDGIVWKNSVTRISAASTQPPK